MGCCVMGSSIFLVMVMIGSSMGAPAGANNILAKPTKRNPYECDDLILNLQLLQDMNTKTILEIDNLDPLARIKIGGERKLYTHNL